MVTFAVLIPAFNAEHTVSRAIESVLAQSRPPDQIIVCDDGSTDGTTAVLAGFGDRITVIGQSNGGLSTARNAALAVAETDFVVLLDADDEWLSNRIADTESLLDQEPGLDIVSCPAEVVNPDGSRTIWFADPFPPADAQRVAILRENFICGSSAVRTSALRAIGGFATDVPHHGEYEGWVRLILNGAVAGTTTDPALVYYRSAGSLSWDPVPTWRTISFSLRRVLEQHQLTEEEEAAARCQVVECERKLALAQAVRARRQSSPGWRRKAWHLAVEGDRAKVQRLKWAVAGSLPPALARRL